MTKRQLATAARKIGCKVEENTIPNGIDIYVHAPKGKCFSVGQHAIVTDYRYFDDSLSEAREAALDDAQRNLPLTECAPDCECRDKQETPE